MIKNPVVSDDTWCNYSDLPSPLFYLNSKKQSNKINLMVSVEVKFEYGMFDNIQLELPMIPEINSNFTIDKKLLIAKTLPNVKLIRSMLGELTISSMKIIIQKSL